MERIDLQCNAKNVWQVASEITFQTINMFETDLCSTAEQYWEIVERNKKRIIPFKFTSKVGFYNKNLDGMIVFITRSKKWWRTIHTEPNKATLVIYLPKLLNMIKELRKERYRIRSDEERNI